MVWPFGSSDPGKDSKNEEPKTSPITAVSNADVAYLDKAKDWAPAVLISLAGLATMQLYASYLRRIPSAAHVQPHFFRRRSIYGRVTSVGDGDNFHLFHTPGGRSVGWGWLRKVPSSRKELKGRTIPIRIAGIDAPENAHFGKPAQPYAVEALNWLSSYILNRNVRAYVYKRDQYERVVATVYVRRFLSRKDVGYEMIKQGLATTYEAKVGAEFGGKKEKYEKAMALAKKKRKGMWSGKPHEFESPREYKNRYAALEKKTGL